MAGQLWRDVVNFLGAEEINPVIFLPLFQMVAQRHTDHSYFIEKLAEHLQRESELKRLAEDIRVARIGYWVWQQRRMELCRWINEAKSESFTLERIRDWWFSDEHDRDFQEDEYNRLDEFLALIRFDPDDQQFLDQLVGSPKVRHVYIFHTHKFLGILGEFDRLRKLAGKTWAAASDQQRLWSEEEYMWASSYYSDQQPSLAPNDEWQPGTGIDPFKLEMFLEEQGLAVGMPSLHAHSAIVLRAAVIDFMEDILDYSRYPRVRGSLQCVECARFVGRSALGYGQLYCSSTCKKRAAKRRYRARVGQVAVLA